LGTTFKIYLPRNDSDQLSRATRASDKVSAVTTGGSQTILVVEDEKAVRELAAQVLQEHGYKVLIAENGTQALQLSLGYQGSIDLLVTDVVMPGMTGWDLAEGFRGQRPDARVLFTSGYSDRALTEQPASADAFDFMPKPFTLESLIHKVQTVLESSQTG
jgi:CheY-like chemotaxis protein